MSRAFPAALASYMEITAKEGIGSGKKIGTDVPDHYES